MNYSRLDAKAYARANMKGIWAAALNPFRPDFSLNEEGLRYEDEWSRHKLLDSVGDLALAGAPIHGIFHGIRGGHASHHALLVELFRRDGQDSGAVRRVVASAPQIEQSDNN